VAKLLLRVEPDGSLRLPPDVLRAAGLGERVELDLEPGSLSLRPAEADGDDLSEEDIIAICREIRQEVFDEKYGHPTT
jgi:antitoxin component of MazEF toxin-antitoxin module